MSLRIHIKKPIHITNDYSQDNGTHPLAGARDRPTRIVGVGLDLFHQHDQRDEAVKRAAVTNGVGR